MDEFGRYELVNSIRNTVRYYESERSVLGGFGFHSFRSRNALASDSNGTEHTRVPIRNPGN